MRRRGYFLTLKDYIGLFNVSKVRKDSAENYFLFQKYQGAMLTRFFEYRGINLKNKKVLDLGSGPGGYSAALKDAGMDVTSVDLTPNPDYRDVFAVKANALQLPFSNGYFDMVICASLIEHLPEPEKLLDEILRVLSDQGIAYLSFPPFYSPVGGHQFAPFHLLGEKASISLARRFGRLKKGNHVQDNANPETNTFENAFGDWGLYVLTIRRVQQMLKAYPVKVIERSTRWLPIDFSGIPILGEFLTWHVQFLFKKA